MGVGTGIFLAAVGAILDFAVKVQSASVNLHTVGLILMIAGAAVALVSLCFWSSWGGFGGYRRSRRVTRDGATVYEDRTQY